MAVASVVPGVGDGIDRGNVPPGGVPGGGFPGGPGGIGGFQGGGLLLTPTLTRLVFLRCDQL